MQQLGEYLIHRLIGQGGMGKVYEAEERLSRRRVALKVLRDDLAQSDDGRRMFLREMTILSHLDHPNVVRCLACTEAGGHLVMVLEHLQGHTLRDELRQHGRLHWDRAVRIAADIASGLGAAHRHDPPIIHRDLKPENVMILTDGRTKVMDFGIAKMVDAMGSQTVYTVGTLQYMSPEQIEGNTVDQRADLYCLGLVLYEMLSGQPPFASESPRELLNLHCTQAPPRLPPEVSGSLPPGLEVLVFELLAKSPDQRPAQADLVRQRLEAIVAAPAQVHAAPSQPMHGWAPPVAAHHASTPVQGSSMGTLMLVEQAGVSHRRGRTIGLIAAIVGVIGLGGAASGYYFFFVRGRAGVEKAVADSKPEPEAPDRPEATKQPEPPREIVNADDVRKRAEEDRKAVDDAKVVDTKVDDDPKPPDDVKDPDPSGGGLLQSFGLGGDDDEPPQNNGLLGGFRR